MSNPKPLKRHAALVPLSKDHHLALLLCWKVRTGLAKKIEPGRIRDYVAYFFDDHLKHHFREEEDILLTKLDAEDPLKIETESQHQELYSLREDLEKEMELTNTLTTFEKKLEAHIRFEERQLFPYLQEKLSEHHLLEIASKLSAEEACDNWQDEFWTKERNKGTRE